VAKATVAQALVVQERAPAKALAGLRRAKISSEGLFHSLHNLLSFDTAC
jgi:hypothetical protein